MESLKRAIVGAALVAVLVFLGGGPAAAGVFIVFAAFFLLPAFVIVCRAPFVRSMPPDLRVTAAAMIVVLLAVPWFFLRKLSPMTLPLDLAASILLTLLAMWFAAPRSLFEELRPALQRSVISVLLVLPVLFALVWLGYDVRAGNEVRYYGLLAVDFGNLASVASALRAAPMLPQSYVAGSGILSYHWLYFTLPAMLSDFLGVTIPSANALILTNLLMAALLFQTIVTAVRWFNEEVSGRFTIAAAAVTVFAPFTTYFYQAAATRFPIGWFALPTRNHLLLSPLTSMLIFGNNTFALVLALFVAIALDRWNRDGRIGDALLGVAALAIAIGYSVTLVFSLALTLMVWTLLGRVRRPLVALALAAVTGLAAVALFFAIGVLTTGGSRHIAIAFDRGQFFRMVLFGLAPLWAVVVLAGRKLRLNIFHVLIAVGIAVPTMLYTTGSAGSMIDFSMKTGSLVAIAFSPLLAPALERLFGAGAPRRLRAAAILVIALGIVQTSVFVLQFPWYRATRAAGHAYSIPADYHDALVWVRDHTPRQAVVVDPQGLRTQEVLYALMVGERRVWLPTVFTDEVLLGDSRVVGRVPVWNAFLSGDEGARRKVASESDYLVLHGSVVSPSWREVRHGLWNVYQSTLRKP
ncbi:MAG TPA: hypothetical protein VGQ65_08335 [Thermoanaerobaculia bacterium]|nr:hypothetical protein [Thermoanaerobaculia bacterium]